MSKPEDYKDPLYMKKWRERNKKKLQKDRRNWYLSHKEKEKKQATEWQKSNRERTVANWKARSAMKWYPGAISVQEVIGIMEKCKYTCHWCSKTNLRGRDLTLEHLKRNNDVNSLTIACLSCNSKRLHNKI